MVKGPLVISWRLVPQEEEGGLHNKKRTCSGVGTLVLCLQRFQDDWHVLLICGVSTWELFTQCRQEGYLFLTSGVEKIFPWVWMSDKSFVCSVITNRSSSKGQLYLKVMAIYVCKKQCNYSYATFVLQIVFESYDQKQGPYHGLPVSTPYVTKDHLQVLYTPFTTPITR